MKKIIAAMSGGVDSSVAAYLLKQQGYEVTGVTFIMTDTEMSEESDIGKSAASVCESIGIPHYVHKHQPDFLNHVIEPFVRAYESGLTPNPCVECNKFVKIPSAVNFADSIGYDGAATGHYVRISKDLSTGSSTGRILLKKALDPKKDQSYVLWTLSQDMLRKLAFPLGEMTKDEVRDIARTLGLSSADKKDSQDICFIPDGDYVSYIERHRGKKVCECGDYIDLNGNVIGSHLGHVKYTIGQRKGLGASFGRHMFVISKDADKNTVTLDGVDENGNEPQSLYTHTVKANNINLIACDNLKEKVRLTARLRYHQKDSPAVAEQTGEDELTLIFDSPQRAVTKGQSLVMYDGDIVVGGGVII